ncbi:hypothetical protein [Priestia megaterium]|uniref:hypothetical protein n=1 Tax=Priestia megaterium TaxID=1404 RepID=UPI000BF2FFB3|nr:hypothetical protein [Priestia megaterium]PFT58078.1 hypothetical protein COK68_00680 [Priestia megaterium]
MDDLENAIPDNRYELAKNTLFPMMFDYVLEETEEEKIKLFVNGFENSISEDYIDLELTRAYFDILHSLRISEITHFIDRFVPKESYEELTLNIPRYSFPVTKEEEQIKNKLDGYRSYLKNKLEQLGLVTYQAVNGEPYRTDTPITEFGHNFYKFFQKQ